MDALPMPEESGESFSCPTGTETYICGHDFHVLQGTLCTNDSASCEKLTQRLKEAVQKTAEVFGGSAEIGMISEVPPLVCYAQGKSVPANYWMICILRSQRFPII